MAYRLHEKMKEEKKNGGKTYRTDVEIASIEREAFGNVVAVCCVLCVVRGPIAKKTTPPTTTTRTTRTTTNENNLRKSEKCALNALVLYHDGWMFACLLKWMDGWMRFQIIHTFSQCVCVRAIQM